MYELPISKISVIIKRKTMNTIFNIAIVAPIMEIQFRNDCGNFISLRIKSFCNLNFIGNNKCRKYYNFPSGF